mgnify:CR=1 FL=1|jgi:hypothetical protein
MTTNGYVLAKVVSFLYNENMNIISKIYSGKIDSHFVAHLIDKAHYCREKYNDNTLGWVDFILGLDQKNLSILEEYIFSN